MEGYQLFAQKEKWHKRTFDMIKGDLISARNNQFIRYESAQDNYLVIVYGRSQVGKTSLILNMIGISEEYMSKVSKTLRGNRELGKSSTATAIIYAKSEDDRYGCYISSNNAISGNEVSYYDDQGMANRLGEIRGEVEGCKMETNSILHIYIPKNYFKTDGERKNITILDLPGIDSNETRETYHVENLMKRYIPVASVCVIVCTAHKIQDLESTKLPRGIDWKRMGHRFVLAITYAYSNDNTKRFFKKTREERKTSFREFVFSEYTNEIKKVLGENSKIEFFPLELGDSMETIKKTELKLAEDQREVEENAKAVLDDLGKAIISREGQRLRSALDDLRVNVKYHEEERLLAIEKEENILKQRKEWKETEIENYKRNINEMESSVYVENNKISDLNYLESKLNGLFICQLPEKAIDFVEENKLFKSSWGKKYLFDENMKLYQKLEAWLKEQTYEINNAIADVLETDEINLVKYVDREEGDLYPRRFLPKALGMFEEKVFLYDLKTRCVRDVCKTIQDKANEDISKCVKDINGALDKIKETRRGYETILASRRAQLKKSEAEFDECEKKIKELKTECDAIMSEREEDEKTLSVYLDYCEKAYQEQRDEVVQQINETTSSDEKLQLLLFLGVLDNDYQKVIGGF